jgi:hypothetical protein
VNTTKRRKRLTGASRRQVNIRAYPSDVVRVTRLLQRAVAAGRFDELQGLSQAQKLERVVLLAEERVMEWGKKYGRGTAK